MAYKIIQSGTGNNRLYMADPGKQMLLSSGIQLRQNIIQQKNRIILNYLFARVLSPPVSVIEPPSSAGPGNRIFGCLYCLHKNLYRPGAAGKCCFLPEILHPAFLKNLFQYVCLRIWFITYLQLFFSAGKIKMDIPDNPIHLIDKIIPVMDQLTAIGNQLSYRKYPASPHIPA